MDYNFIGSSVLHQTGLLIAAAAAAAASVKAALTSLYSDSSQ